jgi:hypothetical protein
VSDAEVACDISVNGVRDAAAHQDEACDCGAKNKCEAQFEKFHSRDFLSRFGSLSYLDGAGAV